MPVNFVIIAWPVQMVDEGHIKNLGNMMLLNSRARQSQAGEHDS